MKKSEIELTICVIGKNESKNITRLFRSLRSLHDTGIIFESIYVDSASTDESALVAAELFDKVLILKHSYYLSAAAGRYVGTKNALGRWILYLDGDMSLCEEFIPIIIDTIRSRKGGGVIGAYVHNYDNGECRLAKYNYRSNPEIAYHFGGASLLKKEDVDAVGGWNYRLFSNEEDDLYIRLRNNNITVRYVDCKMVNHFTKYFTKIENIINIFIPNKNGLGKKYYGFGQMCMSAIFNGYVKALLKYLPYPFVYFLTLLLILILISYGKIIYSITLTIFLILYISLNRGVKFMIIYLGFIPQAILGCRKYSFTYKPVIEKSMTKVSK